MANPIATVDIPKEPAVRRVWVIYQLKLRGWSLRRLGQSIGVTHQAVSAALVLPNAHIEPVIAKALGLKVRDLFPERFDEHGQRIHLTRAPERNSLWRRRNLKDQAVA